MMSGMYDLMLDEVATAANNRFFRREDRELLTANAVRTARQLLSAQPLVLDYVIDLAIGSSIARRVA